MPQRRRPYADTNGNQHITEDQAEKPSSIARFDENVATTAVGRPMRGPLRQFDFDARKEDKLERFLLGLHGR